MKNKIVFNEIYQKTNYFVQDAKNDKISINNEKFYDLSFCSGVLLLGHNCKIFRETLKDFNQKKISIFAHPNIYTEKLAEKVKIFFPNFEKIIFCNSGSESVIKALRICKSINNKRYIVSVTGSWHGSVDQTLYSPDKNFYPQPLSSGLSFDQQKNLKFIPYNGIEKSKSILDKIKNNINCIIIEPVMGSLPTVKSKSYLKFLENYCKKNNIILVFDEILTGFRCEKGSVQNKFNLKPDITLIGKVLGGGFPIGAIGITKKIRQKINKLKKKIIFGGTFSANSYSVYAGLKMLNFIHKNKNLTKSLINKSQTFQLKINEFIEKYDLDVWVHRFDTMNRLVFTKKKIKNRVQRDFLEKDKNSNINKFKNFLFKNRIYYAPNGIIFFSYASKDKSIDHIANVFCNGLYKFFKNKI